MIGGPNFHCTAHPDRGDANLETVECYRDAGVCERWRDAGRKAGQTWGPCKLYERAGCFVIFDSRVHATGFRCYGDLPTCERNRARIKAERDTDNYPPTIDDCAWTAGRQRNGPSIAYPR